MSTSSLGPSGPYDDMTNDVSGHYVSYTFPQFKRPNLKVDVNSLKEQTDASSAEEAVKEIESVAKVMTNSSLKGLTSKDPASVFMTARDVSAYQKALELGIIREVKSRRIMTDGNNPNDYNHDELKSIFASAFVACPTCSIAIRTNYQMEWVDDAGLWHCIRCGIDINPFDVKREGEPEPQTNFGLSAIDDNSKPGNSKPFLMVSNRKHPKKGAFGKLEEFRKKQKNMNELKNTRGKKLVG